MMAAVMGRTQLHHHTFAPKFRTSVLNQVVRMALHTRDCSGPFQNPIEVASIYPFDEPVGMICFEMCYGL